MLIASGGTRRRADFEQILSRPDAQSARSVLRHGRHDVCTDRRIEQVRLKTGGRRLFARHACSGEREDAERQVRWVEADALELPFAARQFDLVTAAFGFRNLANYDHGLAEIYRVLANDGEIGILDFGEPKGLVGSVYRVVLSTRAASHWHDDLGCPRPVRLFAKVSAALSRPGGDAGANAGGRFPRSFLEALYLWDCRTVSGKK